MYAALLTHLLRSRPGTTRVTAAVIGTGQYATAVVTQSFAMPLLDVPAVADLRLDAARDAFLQAGVPAEEIAACDTREEVLAALERGQRVITQDALLLVDLPVQVIVEATGVPEAGAKHARAAIEAGKHVAMVNKEADATVGPILKRLADEAGVVYTAVDGDQHGLLMDMVQWARLLGLRILSGGKARNAEFVYDAQARAVRCGRQTVQLSAKEATYLEPIAPGRAPEAIARRAELLAELELVGGYDLVEMAIAANATGLLPDVETLHTPVVRTREVPEALCPRAEGGVLDAAGAIEVITCLRHADGPGFGGGEFIVVGCDNAYSRDILTTKGLLPNSAGTAALVYRPHHLCGVETPMTILLAALGGLPTGATEYLPRVDIVARARRDLRAGEVVGNDHDPALQALMWPAQRTAPDAPLPLHMAHGNPLVRDVPAGTVLTGEMVRRPEGSALWALREQQDEAFRV